jgi:hypothetical protein
MEVREKLREFMRRKLGTRWCVEAYPGERPEYEKRISMEEYKRLIDEFNAKGG